MTKRIAIDSFKYLFALALLTYVVWSNWGYPQRAALQVQVPPNPDFSVQGKVVKYAPGQSLTIEEKRFGEQPGAPLETEFLIVAKTQIEPAGAGLEPGTMVSIKEAPRGLAWVWKRHAVEGDPVNKWAFVTAVALFFAAALQTIVRWYILVRATGLAFRLPDALRLGAIGIFFSIFLPSSIGGDAIRAWFISREQSRRAVAVATVVIDRVIALWGLFWFVAISGVIFWAADLLHGEAENRLKVIVISAVSVVAATVVAWIVFGLLSNERAHRLADRLDQSGKVGHTAAEFFRAMWMYRQQPRVVWGVLLMALIGHIGFVLTFYCASLTLWDPGQKIPTMLEHFLIVPIGMVIQALPLAPGGAGVGEFGFGKLYALLKCDEASGVLASLVQRVVMWLAGLVGFVVYLRMRPSLQEAGKNTESELASAPS